MTVSLAFDVNIDGAIYFANTEANVTRPAIGKPIEGSFTRLQVFDLQGDEIELKRFQPLIRLEFERVLWDRFKQIYEENYGVF